MSKLFSYKKKIPAKIYSLLEKKGFEHLRPSQTKSIGAGLFSDKNFLVCTPTASGKTLVGEMASLHGIQSGGKALYVVPLKALGSEKHKVFTKEYPHIAVGISTGDMDSSDKYLEKYDWIVLTSEKLDSLLRHHTPWLKSVKTVVFDEIHLLNDPTRGPTLEIVMSILRKELPNLQIIGLSATIGNPKELAQWLDAVLVEDSWRPTTLHKAIVTDGSIRYES